MRRLYLFCFNFLVINLLLLHSGKPCLKTVIFFWSLCYHHLLLYQTGVSFERVSASFTAEVNFDVLGAQMHFQLSF